MAATSLAQQVDQMEYLDPETSHVTSDLIADTTEQEEAASPGRGAGFLRRLPLVMALLGVVALLGVAVFSIGKPEEAHNQLEASSASDLALIGEDDITPAAAPTLDPMMTGIIAGVTVGTAAATGLGAGLGIGLTNFTD
eukprot:TRINITY_DN7146_c0_g1_i1.p2 TRINITY_DN7146_c0_g1~~TRINITY_DN7146_c0_g1_i1.p2  ORF type:complete len:139 (+),score=31.06 TRINITY_DN7146_c0_g1_i1:110-526(+)